MTLAYPSQLKHLLLRAFLASNLPKKISKVGVLDERGMNKSTKTLHRSEVRAIFAVKTHIKCAIWNSSADLPDLPDLPEVVSRSAARTPPSTRAGGQDDGSLNKLLQGNIFLKLISCHPDFCCASMAQSRVLPWPSLAWARMAEGAAVEVSACGEAGRPKLERRVAASLFISASLALWHTSL